MLGYDHKLFYAMGGMSGKGEFPGMFLLIHEAKIQGMEVVSTRLF